MDGSLLAPREQPELTLLPRLTSAGLVFEVGGSIAKGTNLAGDFDCDVFVLFDTEDMSDKLEQSLAKLGLSYERVHGSRDYFQLEYEGMSYELIPVLNIQSPKDAKNVTDMSRFHVHWFLRHADEKLRNDVRLAKQFCKAQKVYGAESYIGGISGHVLDILLVHYKSFDAFVTGVSQWKEQTIIDTHQYYTNVLLQMNEAKTNCPLIVVDPVLPERNAANALSHKKYNQLVTACKLYCLHPSDDFFVVKPFSQYTYSAFVVRINPRHGKIDVVGAQARKVHEYICAQAKVHGFFLEFEEFGWSDTFFYSYTRPQQVKIAQTYDIQGPPVALLQHAQNFRQEHLHIVEKDQRLIAVEQREFTYYVDFLEAMLKSAYIKQRVSSINLITQ